MRKRTGTVYVHFNNPVKVDLTGLHDDIYTSVDQNSSHIRSIRGIAQTENKVLVRKQILSAFLLVLIVWFLVTLD